MFLRYIPLILLICGTATELRAANDTLTLYSMGFVLLLGISLLLLLGLIFFYRKAKEMQDAFRQQYRSFQKQRVQVQQVMTQSDEVVEVLHTWERLAREEWLPSFEAWSAHESTDIACHAKRWSILVHNMQDRSRQFEPVFESVNLCETLKRACWEIEAILCEKEIQVRNHINPSLSLWGDTVLLERVWTNLLLNASTHMSKGGRITLTAVEKGAGWIEVAVKDKGAAIPRAFQERLFEREYRSLNSHPRSTGLGLTLSKRIIEAHRGEIGLDASTTHGTTIWVRIPQATQQAQA